MNLWLGWLDWSDWMDCAFIFGNCIWLTYKVTHDDLNWTWSTHIDVNWPHTHTSTWTGNSGGVKRFGPIHLPSNSRRVFLTCIISAASFAPVFFILNSFKQQSWNSDWLESTCKFLRKRHKKHWLNWLLLVHLVHRHKTSRGTGTRTTRVNLTASIISTDDRKTSTKTYSMQNRNQ